MRKSNRVGAAVVVASIAMVCILATTGCEPPPAVPGVAPGEDLRKSLMPEEKAAEALGEVGSRATTKPTVTPGLVPAPPTEPGETRTTASGIEYQTIKPGKGEPARAGQKVTVQYVGTLDDGREFENSRKSGKPLTEFVGVGKLIKGWDEAVPGMLVGEVRKMTIPPAAGYGAQGSGDGSIPPNATLHFEIELVKAEDAPGP